MAKTILCADDSVTMQTVAEITFGSGDYEYVGARSGDDALEVARDKKPDLILADAQMPDKSGYELCQAVKSDPDLKNIPVVVMCGNSEAYDAARGEKAGADGHVTKPWDTQQMLDKVAEFLSKAESEGVAAGDGAAAVAAPEPPAKKEPPKRAPTPPPAPPKLTPPAAKGEPPRSMTLMGMPSLKMPGKVDKPPGVTAIPETRPTPPVKPAGPEPIIAKGGDGAAVKDLPKPPEGMPRPPMVKGSPTKRFSYAAYARKATPEELAEARASARSVAADAGADLSDGQADALLKLSKEVVERIVWEAVPELAETIIRENLDKLAAK